MLSKIKNFIALSLAEYYWQKSIGFVMDKDFKKGRDYLTKSYSLTKIRTINSLLLDGYINLANEDLDNCLYVTKHALEKIKKNNSLNESEKGYLALYATDLINLSIVHGKFDEELLPRMKSFKVAEVDKRYFKYFPLIDRN
jgi:hypothetical protein